MSPGAPKVVWGRGSTLIYEDLVLLLMERSIASGQG
jgi:hypothetical protein